MLEKVIDYGFKEKDCYEYWPLFNQSFPLTGIASFDVGKKHFGVYIEQSKGVQKGTCLYQGLWKIGERMTIATQKKLSAHLSHILPVLEKCTVVLVEQQLRRNYVAVRLQQALMTWCELKVPQVEIITISSDLKYRRLGDQIGEGRHTRKRWAITHSLSLLTDPRAQRFITELDRLRLARKEWSLKADDVCDAYLQLLAWQKGLSPKEQGKYF